MNIYFGSGSSYFGIKVEKNQSGFFYSSRMDILGKAAPCQNHACQDHVKTMFVKTMSCFSRPCHACQDHVFETNWILLDPF